jgi:thioredoxin reductase (NADPH)
MSEKKEVLFDTIILGGGPAGLSASIYTARGNLKTAIIDITAFGGQPSNYIEIENFPSYSKINSYELMQRFESHADSFGIEKFPFEEIQTINLKSEIKTIESLNYIFKAKTIIIATGAKPLKLGIKGENDFFGKGVSYCAVCDGAFYKNKDVAVIGGGNSALEEACYLTKFANKVYVIHRRNSLKADKIIQERAFQNKKIEFILNTIPLEIKGENKVSSIVLKNNLGEEKELSIDGIFPYIGYIPNIELFDGKLKQNNEGFIETDNEMRTSENGVFAIGDVRNTPLRQVITAAADGAIAGYTCVKYIENLKEKITT